MRNLFIITAFILLTGSPLANCQNSDPLISNCALSAGSNAKYLKDFRIQLGKGSGNGELRYKANISLWKNTKYRFTMCNAEDSQGKLILSITDEASKTVISSYDPKTGKIYPFVDFICNKSGVYQLNFDFNNNMQGSGVGVVSMIK
jgi:hypothetical protein